MTNDEPIDSQLTAMEKQKVLSNKTPRTQFQPHDSFGKPCAQFKDTSGKVWDVVDAPQEDRRTEMDRRAIKDDTGKALWHLLPFRPLQEIVELLMYGAKKYDSHNWKRGFTYSRCFDAMMRHIDLWWHQGLDYDQEILEATGKKIHHLAAVAFYALILIEFHYSKTGTDDRSRHNTNQQVGEHNGISTGSI